MAAPRSDAPATGDPCALANAIDVIGERWTFFILREALGGATRYTEFRQRLGIATDVLAARLARLVEAGVMERRDYREPGQRTRDGYHLTPAGEELATTIQALQQWGEAHTPSQTPTSVVFTDDRDRPVRVAFVDQDGQPVDRDRVVPVRLPGA